MASWEEVPKRKRLGAGDNPGYDIFGYGHGGGTHGHQHPLEWERQNGRQNRITTVGS